MSAKKRSYLMTVWEGGGNVPPVLAVAKKLLDAGHDVRIMSDRCNEPEVRAVGAAFRAYKHAPSRADKSAASDIIRDHEATSPAEGMGRVIDRIMCGPSADYAADTLDALAQAPVDAIITNEMLLGVMAAAEKSRIPFALLCPNISLAPMDGIPPLGPGLLPPRTREEKETYAAIAQANAALFNSGLPALNATRASLGLGTLGHLYEQWDRATLNLLATARAFDFAPAQLPPKYSYVGPQFHDQKSDEHWTSPWAEGDARPLVLVSFSTTHQAQGPALQRVIDAARGLPIRLLVTLGPALDPSSFTVPSNVKLTPAAPHRIAMRDAAAIVCHGGHGTVMRALAALRPLLVMPMGRDQNDNAARVLARGAGLVLDPAQATSEEIRAALTRLVDEPAFTASARALGAAILEEAAQSRVVALLEGLGAATVTAAA